MEIVGEVGRDAPVSCMPRSPDPLLNRHRTFLGLYIIDAQLARIFDHDPLLRHDSLASDQAAPDEIFNAPNAAEWKAKILLRGSQNALPKAVSSVSHFNLYLSLQNILATVVEEQLRGTLRLGSEEYERLFTDLMD